MEDIYQRTEIVLGNKNIEKLKKLNICICGIGGVGSYTLESLARIGVGNITIIDKDIVDITNINRQLIATSLNIGKSKVEEAKKRINDINPNINISAIQDAINVTNVNKYITTDFDYVIDAIDDVEAKVAIIRVCKKNNIRVISSMGMANRLDPKHINVSDISKTLMCPLAKIVRKRLKEEQISNVKVAFSTEQPIKSNTRQLGSVPFVPAVAGLIISSEVVKELLEI